MSSRNTPGNNAPRGNPGKKPSKSQIQKRQAAQRAMAAASGARASRNKRLVQVFVPIVVVLALVGILIGVYSAQNHNKKGHTTSAADQAVTQAVTGVASSVLDKVGDGGASGPTNVLTGDALTSDGKPRVLYIGAEWCPYCAAERWALANALSRFGTLTDLGETQSGAAPETDPNTATLSFHGAKFTSDYISLTADETQDGSRNTLDKPNSSDTALWLKLTGNGSFPFIDIGGKYQFGVQYDPAILAGKSHAEIADAMSDPSSTIGKAIDGSANILTAAICEVTNQQPSDVCSSAGVTAAKSKLNVKS